MPRSISDSTARDHRSARDLVWNVFDSVAYPRFLIFACHWRSPRLAMVGIVPPRLPRSKIPLSQNCPKRTQSGTIRPTLDAENCFILRG
jgi:hypothetical protein